MLNRARVFGEYLRRPEYFFLAIASVVGGLLVVIVPPLQSPDEVRHFARSYSISELNLRQDNLAIGSGAHLPSAITQFETIVNRDNLPLLESKKYTESTARNALSVRVTSQRHDYMFINLASYSPVAYVPQASGIALSRIATSRIGAMFYVARFANLIFFIALCFFALRLLPVGKWLATGVLLSPMALFAASSLSADTSVLAYTAILVGLTTKIFLQKTQRVSGLEWGVLTLACCMLALSKQAYIVLVPIIILLVIRRVSIRRFNKKSFHYQRILPVIFICIATVLAYVSWSLINRSVNSDVSLMQRLEGWNVQPQEQLARTMHDPIYFVNAALNTTFGVAGNDIVQSAIGSFGWLNVHLPLWAVIVYCITFVLLVGYKGDRVSAISTRQRKLLLLSALSLSLICYAGILIGLFMVWTPIDYDYVAGFQGRYLLPLFLLLVPGLAGVYYHTVRLRYIIGMMAIVLGAMIFVIIKRYYL